MTGPERLRLYIVRHGVTAWNREMRMQGHTDIPLDAEGLAQAQKLGARLSHAPHPPQVVWSSDLLRATRTAEEIARPLSIPMRTTPLLRETMLGAWEGLTREEIEARGDANLLGDYLRDSYRYRPPGADSLDAVWTRLLEAAEMIRCAHPSGQVAIVGHGGSLRALICAALDAPVASMRRLGLDNASLSIIEELRHGSECISRVTLLNDTSHLKDREEMEGKREQGTGNRE